MYYNAVKAPVRAVERMLDSMSIETRMALYMAPELKETLVKDIQDMWSKSSLVRGARGRAIKKWVQENRIVIDILFMTHHLSYSMRRQKAQEKELESLEKRFVKCRKA